MIYPHDANGTPVEPETSALRAKLETFERLYASGLQSVELNNAYYELASELRRLRSRQLTFPYPSKP
jgi:uncharacterized protein YecE (DUF72 family)